jgi:hypothetical protein
MTRKMSAFGVLTGAVSDFLADYFPIIDASVADAVKNKTMLLSELKRALGLGRPPDTTLFSFTANGTAVTQSSSYDAKLGLSFGRTDSGVGGAERAAFLGKAVPASTPWTATAKLKIPAGITTPHINAGMSLYNSGTGKIIVFGNQNLAGVIKSFVSYFTNLNTFNSDIKVLTISAQQLPEWFRISFDGTTYTFSISYDDGITWDTFTTALAASFFTADKIGVAIETFDSVANLKPKMLVQHWDDPDLP